MFTGSSNVRCGRSILKTRAGDLCGSLSKGLRQAVPRLARALLSDPTVLFLDEPTSGLDPVATREVHELIGSLREHGVTIFLTTHRLEEAERLCDRVAILNTITLPMIPALHSQHDGEHRPPTTFASACRSSTCS